MTEPQMPETAQQAPTSTHNAVWRLQGIVFEPTRTFEDINRKPSFLLPLLVCIGVAVLSAFLLYQKVDLADIMEAQIRSSGRGSQLSSEEVRTQVNQIVESPLFPFMKWGGPVAGAPVIVFALSGLLLLAVFLSGGESTYGKFLGAVTHSYFIYSLTTAVLTVIVFTFSNDPKSINIENPLLSNLGFLFDRKESPALYRLGSAVDVINIYFMYLLALGTSKVSKRVSLAKGLTLIGIIYILYVGVGVGRALIMG